MKKFKTYYITHQDEETKKKNIELWVEVRDNGTFIKGGFGGDYRFYQYKYNDRIYDLWENEELGVMSYIDEWEIEK